MCWFDITVNICVALGGLGTVGTLIYMIFNAKTQAKQVKAVHEIQSVQLDVLYKPDIRIIAWTDNLANNDLHPSIWLENNGENLIVNDIKELSEAVINKEGMHGWFPQSFDKGRQVSIPINNAMRNLNAGDLFQIEVTNRLAQRYFIRISKVKNKIEITKIVKK